MKAIKIPASRAGMKVGGRVAGCMLCYECNLLFLITGSMVTFSSLVEGRSAFRPNSSNLGFLMTGSMVTFSSLVEGRPEIVASNSCCNSFILIISSY
ncbi:hypothetical protein [Wolbachia endosymbiont (group A) of Brachyopa scutellaris]|uniref:hypothetical protein n=1 Tax=Wolbachia endosymbiont (group A) of Brachyopa scutellaris TaxID=3066140 RepID=UPI0031331331